MVFPRTFRRMAVALAACVTFSCAFAQSPAATASPAQPQIRLVPFDVTINSSAVGSWLLLERDGTLYAPDEAIDEWRLTRRGGVVPFSYRGKSWFPLTGLPGFELKMDFSRQSLEVSFSPNAFIQSRVTEPTPAEKARTYPAHPAFFFNYDTNLSYTAERGAGSTRDVGVLGEVGYASEAGVLTSSFVGRHLDNSDPTQPRSFHRLETAFARDFVDSGLTMRVGDSTLRSGVLLRPVYYGGAEIGRNFGLAPTFITRPLPVIGGTAAAPSTVELYVNDALRQTSKVPTGPFVIDNYPLLTGSGQARLVVRDLLGRESVVVQSFFTTNNMLEEGLTDWNAAAGWAHRDIGGDDDRYDEPFAAGLWRHGMTKELTLEANGQFGAQRRVLSLGAVHTLPLQTVGLVGFALSDHQGQGTGRRWLLGLEHNSLRNGLSISWAGSTRTYTEFALESAALPSKREASVSYTYASSQLGTFGIGAARLASYDKDPVTTYTLNYALRLTPAVALNLSATRVVGTGGGTSVNASLSVALDPTTNVLAVASSHGGRVDGYATATKGLTPEGGVGWRVLGGAKNASAYSEGGVYYEGTKVRLSADASASSAEQALRLGSQGSFVLMDGSLFASRRITNSFALVEIDGYPDVGVGLHGRTQARTDSSGRALLAGLTPFTTNSIQIDPKELPIGAEIDNIEQVVVPPARSGVKVVFPVRSGRAALLSVVFDDGQPAPAGAQVELAGSQEVFYVARRGEVFVTGMQQTNQLRLKWKDADCRFEVRLPDAKPDEITRTGPVACHGVQR